MKTCGRNIRNLRCADDTLSLAESSSAFKEHLMRVNEAGAKAGLQLNVKKTTIMAAKEIHNFNMDDKDIKTGNDSAGSIINSNGGYS